MNVFTFSGNLGRDAELRVLASGSSVASFSVPVRSGYGDHEKTSWIRCSLFGKRADSLTPYLKKGQQVVVTGEYVTNEYEKDGVTRMTAECRVSNLDLVGKRSDSNDTESAPQQASNPAPSIADFEDEIPFQSPYKRKEYLV